MNQVDTEWDDVSVKPGDMIAGKYRVEQLLGKGGMGMVLAATHVDLEQKVAVKLLLARRDQPIDKERFSREARIAAKLRSEHVVRVTDTGVLDDGNAYIVMEFLEGEDLNQLSRELGGLEVTTAVDYLMQAAMGLAVAHANGIIHRDLKPANLFITETADGSPLVKILDFGISKLVVPDSTELTGTNDLMGSPRFMAPEQLMSSRTVDQRCDIWALGAILFEVLSGKAAFRGDTLPEICSQILYGTVRKLTELRPDVPQGLERVIERCLSRDLDERLPDICQFANAVAPFGVPESERYAAKIDKIFSADSSLSVSSSRSVSRSTDRAITSRSLDARAGTSTTNAVIAPARATGRAGSARLRWAGAIIVGVALGVVARLVVAPADDASGRVGQPAKADKTG